MRPLTQLCRTLAASLLFNVILFCAAPAALAQAQPGQLIISEIRWRGPRGILDEFVEIYNASGQAHAVAAADGSPGYAVVASDGLVRCLIPNGTLIPARGHFLCVNDTPNVGYGLDSYPAGNGTTATGDAFFSLDIPETDPDGDGPLPAYQAGVALFHTALPVNFTLAHRLDAVGSQGEPNALYKEGAGLPNLIRRSINYSWYRNMSGGSPRDTGDNGADFVFVSPDGEDAGAGRQLGAPGPENLSSPRVTDAIALPLFSPCLDRSLPPNRERYFDPYTDTLTPTTTYDLGTLTVRRRVVNNTGQPITRLRFRVVIFTTFPAAGTLADLRLLTSPDATVGEPCAGVAREVRGLKLEQGAAVIQPNGGGLNSTVSADSVTPTNPLPAADDPTTPEQENAVDVQFLLGVVGGGTFRFFIVMEALP